jgi:carboxylesterase type B
MQAKPYPLIISALTTSTVAFGPTVDEKVVFSDYIERSQEGNFVQRPLLIGNADNEAGLFRAITALGGTNAPESVWTTMNQGTFDCPAAARANISVSNGIPTWRYRWFGDFPNTRITSVPDSGAWHASELPLLFDIVPSGVEIPGNTPEEIEIGNYFRGAWATFAKDPVNGLTNYGGGWPSYDVGKQTLVRLAYQNQTGTNLALGNTYDTSCPAIFAVSNNGSSNGTTTSSGTPSSTSSRPAPTKTKTHSEGAKWMVSYSVVLLVLGTIFLNLI